jgi:multisubunit Na+/H+ antiporter MnhE subunit
MKSHLNSGFAIGNLTSLLMIKSLVKRLGMMRNWMNLLIKILGMLIRSNLTFILRILRQKPEIKNPPIPDIMYL